MSSPHQTMQVSNLKGCPHSPVLQYVHTLSLPTPSTPLAYRNKKISYACMNVVKTLNCATKIEESLFVPLHAEDCISALAELESEDLVVGTKQGRIYLENNSSWIEPDPDVPESSVKQILIIGPVHIIVEFSNSRKSLVDVQNRQYLWKSEQDDQVCRLKENFFATFCNGFINVTDVHHLERTLRLNIRCSAMRAERDNFLLLLSEYQNTQNLTIWDSEKNSTLRPFEIKRSRIKTDQFNTLVLIDSKTFVIPGWDNGVCVDKYSYNEITKKWEHVRRSETSGFDKVTSMIYVDDWIMYATPKHYLRNIYAGIHVFDKNLDQRAIDTILANEDDLSLRALDGYIAVELKTSQSIRIIKYSRHKKRLFIGEGDFSYTEAFTKKHRNLSEAITATEIKTQQEVEEQLNTSDARQRLKMLEDQGVELLFEIDATRIHEHFPSRRFERIHWNCPFGGSAEAMSKGAFKDVILKFFASCREIQRKGDRIYITLVRETQLWEKRQKENPIVLGSAMSGYRLVKKREFGKERYPGYEHKKTSGLAYGVFVDCKMKEFVFEKVRFGKYCTTTKTHQIKKYDPTKFRNTNQYIPTKSDQDDLTDYYFDCSTDDDSSDYDEESFDNRTTEVACGNSMLQPGSEAHQHASQSNYCPLPTQVRDGQSWSRPTSRSGSQMTAPVLHNPLLEDFIPWIRYTEGLYTKFGRVCMDQVLDRISSTVQLHQGSTSCLQPEVLPAEAGMHEQRLSPPIIDLRSPSSSTSRPSLRDWMELRRHTTPKSEGSLPPQNRLPQQPRAMEQQRHATSRSEGSLPPQNRLPQQPHAMSRSRGLSSPPMTLREQPHSMSRSHGLSPPLPKYWRSG